MENHNMKVKFAALFFMLNLDSSAVFALSENLESKGGCSWSMSELGLKLGIFVKPQLDNPEILREVHEIKKAYSKSKRGERLEAYAKSRLQTFSARDFAFVIGSIPTFFAYRLSIGNKNIARIASLIESFYALKKQSLTINELVLLAETVSSYSKRDAMILDFALSRLITLSPEDLIALVEKIAYEESADRIISDYVSSRAITIAVDELLLLVDFIADMKIQKLVVLSFVNAKGSELSISEVIEISEAAGSFFGQDEVIVAFVASQTARLSIGDLRRLAKCLSYESSLDDSD